MDFNHFKVMQSSTQLYGMMRVLPKVSLLFYITEVILSTRQQKENMGWHLEEATDPILSHSIWQF